MGVRTLSSFLLLARPSQGFYSIYNRTRKSFICLGILLAITHVPTFVIGAIWMTNLRIGPSKLYPVIPGCFLESTLTYEFWRVITPSVVRGDQHKATPDADPSRSLTPYSLVLQCTKSGHVTGHL
jgi:hypothetical protein